MTRAAKAIILLSGGIDSATCLAIAKEQGFLPIALSFRYGQRHVVELEAAKKVAISQGVQDHRWIDIDLRVFGGSALTADIEVPKDRSETTMNSSIPITYVPARNTIFLSFALALAEVEKSSDIFIGINAVDYSGYPDCRPEYIDAFSRLGNLATKATVENGSHLTIHTPLLKLSKAEIIDRGLAIGVDYGLTISCYDPLPGAIACGHCDSCQLRQKGFSALGIPDPAVDTAYD